MSTTTDPGDAADSFVAEVRTFISDKWQAAVEDLSNVTDLSSRDSVTQSINRNTTSDKWLTALSRQTVNFLQNVTDTNIRTNSETPEVTISRPEVPDSDIGAAEKVVIGAVIIVAILAIVATILRVCRPFCYSKKNKNNNDDNIEKSFGIVESDSKLSGYTNFGLEIASNSSGSSEQSKDWSQGSGSNPSTDWSELSSDVTKSTDQSPSYTDMPKKQLPSNSSIPAIACRHGPSGVMKRYASDDRLSAKSSPLPPRRPMNDEVISVVSTHSLEPLRMEQLYRNRWDDQWDPYGSLPRGNLSHHSHPSESRLSLNSYSSHSSNPTFPIPSRDTVKQMHVDISSRYQGGAKVHTPVKKEKHVRVMNPSR